MMKTIGMVMVLATVTPSQMDHGFRHDFRGGKWDDPFLNRLGKGWQNYAKLEPEGFRVTLPASEKPSLQIGAGSKVQPSGDFTITATFELLDVGTPKTGYGTGVTLQIVKNVEKLHIASISRMVHPVEGDVFLAHHGWPRKAEEKLPYKRTVHETTLISGKIRLQRKGSIVHFSFAPFDSSEFTEIMKADFGPEDIKFVLLYANPGNAKVPLDVRFLDFEIQTEEPPPDVFAQQEMKVFYVETPKWIWWVVGGASAGVFLGIVGLLVWRKRAQEDEEDEEDEEEENADGH